MEAARGSELDGGGIKTEIEGCQLISQCSDLRENTGTSIMLPPAKEQSPL